MPTATKARPVRRPVRRKPSLGALTKELAQLRERVEELEDLRDLNNAEARNADKPAVPWTTAKAALGLV